MVETTLQEHTPEPWQTFNAADPKVRAAINACAGLALDPDVPLGALREVVEALEWALVALHRVSLPAGDRELRETYAENVAFAQAALAKLEPVWRRWRA